MQKNKLYIHVGMPRTGTTFLQQEVFPRIKNIDYLEHDLPYLFSINPNKLEKTTLYSHEVLSYSFLRDNMAYNLHHCFPDANIIICVRDSESFKRSMYGMKIIRGYKYDYKHYLSNRLYESDKDIQNYVALLKKLFPYVFVYSFDGFKKDVPHTVKRICDFMHVEIPSYTNKKLNHSVPFNLCRRWMYFNRLFPKKIMNPLHHIGEYLIK